MDYTFTENITNSELDSLLSSDNNCLAFLANAKWAGGFICLKCGNDNSCEGKTPHSRRCTRCKTEASATANTLFHNIKFPVNKAFVIAFDVINNNGFSSTNLAEKLGLKQAVYWNFRNKVEDKIAKLARQNDTTTISVTDILAGKIDSPFF